MNLNDLVIAFKRHQLQYGLNGDSSQQELYKWKLVTKQIGHPNTDAEDFAKEINALRFKNLCYSTQLTAIRHFAEYEPEDYREAFKSLFDEKVDLQQRIDTFTSACKTLWDKKIKKNFSQSTSAMCDERLTSCFLTLHNPKNIHSTKVMYMLAYAIFLVLKRRRQVKNLFISMNCSNSISSQL